MGAVLLTYNCRGQGPPHTEGQIFESYGMHHFMAAERGRFAKRLLFSIWHHVFRTPPWRSVYNTPATHSTPSDPATQACRRCVPGWQLGTEAVAA